MSVVDAIITATPSATPVVQYVTKTVTVDTSSHLFQLAEIIKYLALGAGFSIVHTILKGKFGLPKWVNIVLPIAYAAVGGLAITVVDNTVNWNDWYQVALQVFAGAGSLYGLVTLVNAVNPTTTTTTDLPVVTNP